MSELTKVREMVCISCPIGCELTLYTDENDDLVVKGNRCPRGKEYAREEFFAPKRVVTATARTTSKDFPRVPVRTDAPLPKEHIDDLLKRVYELDVPVPIRRGQVILEDFADTGVSLVASLSVHDGGAPGRAPAGAGAGASSGAVGAADADANADAGAQNEEADDE